MHRRPQPPSSTTVSRLRRDVVSSPRAIAAGRWVRDRLTDLCAPMPEHREWRRIDGDHTLRLEYELTPDSVVFDVGGFRGQWASDLVAMYGCRIQVFEPVISYAQRIERRFAHNPLVTVHPYGLAGTAGEARIVVAGDASSHVRSGQLPGELQTVALRTPAEVLSELGLEQLDLMKVNIEGAEFDLLAHLIATGIVERIKDLQVQFHPFVPEARRRADDLRDGLRRSHEQAWGYDFLWENWSRRSSSSS